jgi:beta-fructofuranosidase
MDRRKFIASSALVAFHAGTSSALNLVSQDSAGQSPDQALREKLSRDPLRPQYHLLPQTGFLGDPCAPRFFQGNYHAFFHGSFGGRGWHHAMSPDLIHWKHLPIALAPTPDSYDSYGTFTGSILPGTQDASVIYTGVTRVPAAQETIRNEGLREVQCIATSNDADLRSWKKLDKPVIDGPPPGLAVTGFRDPFSWKDGDTWYIGVGSGFSQLGGAVLLYRSTDGRQWEYLHPLARGTWNGESSSNPVPSGEMWECPDFFPLGDKYVLLYSSEHTTFWQVGTFDKRELRFVPERGGLLDNGAYYAPKSMVDGRNRRILWGWVQETRPEEAIKAAGWAGSMSLPRVLTLGEGNALQMEVAEEFTSLRYGTITINQPQDADKLSDALSRAPIRGRAGEILCTFKAGGSNCGMQLQLGGTSNQVSLLSITFQNTNNRPSVSIGDKTLSLNPDPEGNSSIHIWIDGSIIEAFVDKRQAVTTRCYASPEDSGEILVAWKGPVDVLKSMVISSIRPISGDRLTA